jgi:hypothetical protein
MSYTVTTHNDTNKKFNVTYKGYNIEVIYPSDVQTFSELTSERLDLILSGILMPYESMADYVESDTTTPSTTTGTWL